MLRQYFAAVENLSSCCLPSAYGQNRRQEVFNRGALRLRKGGLTF